MTAFSRHRILIGILCGLLPATSLAGTAREFAQLQQTAGAEAQQRLEQGRRLLDSMRYEEATRLLTEAVEFFQSSDLREHHAAHSEARGLLAAAHLFAGDADEARNTLRALFMVDSGWDFPPERRSPELARLIEAIRTELGSLRRSPLELHSTPEGATVLLDGFEMGKTPLTTGPLLPGRHVLALELAGRVSKQEVIFAGPGTRIEWSLEVDPEAALLAAAPPPRSFLRRSRGTLLLGAAGLGAGATTVFALMGRGAATRARETPQTEVELYSSREKTARSMTTAANLSFYLSLGSAILGTSFLLADRKSTPADQPAVQAGVALLPGGASVVVGGRF